ncbi:MAG TPA: PEP-CTERM sorting domain-containing protein [Chthoniobacteraceae bacterium]|nr:PEP-CTERM sorting domain-containing protein [Chthoniobacteraceae bacterium]
MKALIVCGCLALGGLSLQAGTYELTSFPGGSDSWDALDWNLLSGTGGVYPDAGDTILNINDSDTARSIALNGDRTVAALGKTATGKAIRFLNTNNQNNLLKVEGDLSVTAGTYVFRSANNGRLSVEMENLVLGQTTTTGTNTASVTLADGAGYRNVSFTVSGTTTFQGYSGRLEVRGGATAADTHIHLGVVVFDLPAIEGSISAGIVGIQGGALIGATGLQTTERNARGYINGVDESKGEEGIATLQLDGDTGAYDFDIQLNYGLRLEKTGSSLQVLSRNAGNSYTGGTLVTGGALAIRNTGSSSSGLGTGAVEVSGSGILAGTGRVALAAGNAVTVKAGGVIAPGEDNRLLNPETPAFQTLTFNGVNQSANETPILDMQEGASFLFRVDATGASDRISFINYKTGGLLLDEGGITVNILGELSEGVLYTLMDFSTGSGLEEGLSMGSGFEGYTATFHYDDAAFGGAGKITMTVAAVPEPGALGLLLLGGLAGLAATRSKRD